MSKKKGKLTKVETFYIDNNSDKDVSELAKDLNRTESTIKKHIDATKDTDHITKVTDGSSTAGELMGHKEDRGVTIMTQAASEVSDETRGSRINKARNHDKSIHIIKK